MLNHVKDVPADEWTIHQCANGCIHLRMDHMTLTFSPAEFAQFAQLIRRASLQFAIPTPAAIRPS